jgi:hypothetical protein
VVEQLRGVKRVLQRLDTLLKLPGTLWHRIAVGKYRWATKKCYCTLSKHSKGFESLQRTYWNWMPTTIGNSTSRCQAKTLALERRIWWGGWGSAVSTFGYFWMRRNSWLLVWSIKR